LLTTASLIDEGKRERWNQCLSEGVKGGEGGKRLKPHLLSDESRRNETSGGVLFGSELGESLNVELRLQLWR